MPAAATGSTNKAKRTTAKPPPLRRPATKDHLRKQRQLSLFVSFCTEDLPEPEGLKLKHTDADKRAYEAAIETWRAEVEENTVEAVIKSMSRRAYQDLVDACPPTEAQIAKAKLLNQPPPDNDINKFAPGLIVAGFFLIGENDEHLPITQADAEYIWDEWPNGEVDALVSTIHSLCSRSRLEVYRGKSGGTRG